MTETTRYLRYSLPGLVAILMFSVFWLVSDFQKTTQFVAKFKDNGLWSGVLAALASLALGFLFAQLYHSFYWSFLMPRWPSVDNYDLLTKLLKEGRLRILDQDDIEITADDLKPKNIKHRRRTWTIGNYLFRFHCPKQSARMVDWIERLVDYTHSAGVTILGIFTSFLVWLLLHIFNWPANSKPWFNGEFFIAIVIFVVVWRALANLYRKNRMALEETSNSVLLASIKEISNEDDLITIYYYRVKA